jgi:hypothetical protein
METKQKVIDAINKEGIAYINVYSQDCDGVQSQYHKSFTNVEDFYKWEENFYEWAEGSQGYSLTDKDNLDEPATWGGWGDY